MNALKDTAACWLAAGTPAAIVEVLEVRGSAPREAGTRMLVAAGALAGTIGGGHLELEAIRTARAALAAGRLASASPAELAESVGSAKAVETVRPALATTPEPPPALPFERGYALGPSLGQCCGGALTLRFAALDAASLAAWPDEAALFHLQLFGAGHVGRSLARLLATLPCRVQWIDEREEEFPADWTDWPAHVERVCVDAVEAEVDAAPPGAFFLVMTHSHDLDLRIVEAVLRRGDFSYCGLIGSETKRARFLHRLQERGVDPAAIARLTCPIGVPGITDKAPEVLAVAVAAQLLQVAGGTGTR